MPPPTAMTGSRMMSKRLRAAILELRPSRSRPDRGIATIRSENAQPRWRSGSGLHQARCSSLKSLHQLGSCAFTLGESSFQASTPPSSSSLQVHGRPCEPRVALVKKLAQQRKRPAARSNSSRTIGSAAASPGRASRYRWMMTVVGASSMAKGTRRTRRLRPFYRFCCPPAPPSKSAGRES